MTHHWKVGPVMIVIKKGVKNGGPYKLAEKFSRVNLGCTRVLYQSGVITYSIYKGAHLLHIDISFDKRSLIFDTPIRLVGGNSNIFYVHPKNWGRWTHFDEHFFFQLAGLKPPPRIRSVWKTQVDHYIPLLTQWLRCLTSCFKCLSPSIDGCSQGFLISWSSSAKMCHIRTCETGRGSNWRPNTDVAWRELSDVRTVCMSMWQVEKHGGSGILLFQNVVDVAADVFECFLVVTVSWYSRFLKVLRCCFLLLLPLSLSRSPFYRRSTRWFECAILTAMARQFSVAMRNHEKPTYSILLNAGFLTRFPFEVFQVDGSVPWLSGSLCPVESWDVPVESWDFHQFVQMELWGEDFHHPFWWSNYSDLTRPIPPNGGLVREILFQGNPDWWNIILWPDFGVISGRILDWWFSLIVYSWRCGEVISWTVRILWNLFLLSCLYFWCQ